MAPKTAFATYACENNHKFNVELHVPDNRYKRELAPVDSAYTTVSISLREDYTPGPQMWNRKTKLIDGVVVACDEQAEVSQRRILCPECQTTATDTRQRVRGSYGHNACEAICEKATSANCSCQCGGVNHGIRA